MRRALGPARRRRSAGCGLVPLLLFGLSPAGSAAAALPRSLLPDFVLFSVYLRLRPIAVRAAMPKLHCARDRVTCAARARQRGSSVCGRDRGRAVLERGTAARERGNVGGSGRTVVWRERGSTARE